MATRLNISTRRLKDRLEPLYPSLQLQLHQVLEFPLQELQPTSQLCHQTAQHFDANF